MLPLAIVGLGLGVAAPLGALWRKRRQQRAEKKAAPAIPPPPPEPPPKPAAPDNGGGSLDAPKPPNTGIVPPPKPAPVGPPSLPNFVSEVRLTDEQIRARDAAAANRVDVTKSEPKGKVDPDGKLLWDVSKLALKAVGVGEVMDAVELQVKLNLAAADAVRAMGGNKARQDVTAVVGSAVLGGQVIQNAAEKAARGLAATFAEGGTPEGEFVAAAIDGNIDKIKQAAFAAGVLGPGAIVAKVAGETASAVLGQVAGKQAEQAARSFVKQFDPTATGTPASELAAALGDAVRSLPFLPRPPVEETPVRQLYGPEFLSQFPQPSPELKAALATEIKQARTKPASARRAALE
jgi:hypothetical protein